MTGTPAWRFRALQRRKLREELGLSVETIAARIGVSVRRFKALESGVNRPKSGTDRFWLNGIFWWWSDEAKDHSICDRHG